MADSTGADTLGLLHDIVVGVCFERPPVKRTHLLRRIMVQSDVSHMADITENLVTPALLGSVRVGTKRLPARPAPISAGRRIGGTPVW